MTTMNCVIASTPPLFLYCQKASPLPVLLRSKTASNANRQQRVRDSNRPTDPRLDIALPSRLPPFAIAVPTLPGRRAHFLQAVSPRLVEDSGHGD